MPTYQYACPDCGNKFELKQKFTDVAVKTCPRCQRRRVYRVVGQVAISFKGSGWYITDNKSSSEKHTLEHKPKEAAANGNGATNGAEKSEKTETATENKAAEPASKPTEKSVADKPATPAKKD